MPIVSSPCPFTWNFDTFSNDSERVPASKGSIDLFSRDLTLPSPFKSRFAMPVSIVLPT